MKLNSIEQLSVLACCTGLVLAALCAVAWYHGVPSFEQVSMLLAAVVGFEVFLFGQELTLKVRKRRG
jgi:hypothetical protein